MKSDGHLEEDSFYLIKHFLEKQELMFVKTIKEAKSANINDHDMIEFYNITKNCVENRKYWNIVLFYDIKKL